MGSENRSPLKQNLGNSQEQSEESGSGEHRILALLNGSFQRKGPPPEKQN